MHHQGREGIYPQLPQRIKPMTTLKDVVSLGVLYNNQRVQFFVLLYLPCQFFGALLFLGAVVFWLTNSLKGAHRHFLQSVRRVVRQGCAN